MAEIAELEEGEADDAANRLVNSSPLRVLDRERRRFQLHHRQPFAISNIFKPRSEVAA